MKLLKGLTCVMLTSAAMLSASGYTYFGGVDGAEEQKTDTVTSVSATALTTTGVVSTSDFQMTPNETAAIVLTTLINSTTDQETKDSLTSIMTGLVSGTTTSAVENLSNITFTSDDVEATGTLTTTKDALVTFLSAHSSTTTPGTWYNSSATMVPTSEVTTDGETWKITTTQKLVIELARQTSTLSVIEDLEGGRTNEISTLSLLTSDATTALTTLKSVSWGSSTDTATIYGQLIAALEAAQTSSDEVITTRGRLNSQDHTGNVEEITTNLGTTTLVEEKEEVEA